MNCHNRRKDECSLLRRYIGQSWILMDKNEIHTARRISFLSYCDTFWDLHSREDENLIECQRSWICPKGQRRCETGQCVEPRWINDDQWDCADASDEHFRLVHNTKSALEQATFHDFTNQSYFVPMTCNQSNPFLCLSSKAVQPGFSCFDLSQIGDGYIDCAGAMDERNTLQHCSQSSSMIGVNFFCLSTNTCIPYHHHCLHDSRCPNRSDDEHWCSRQHQLTHRLDIRDFTCFDGRWAEYSRCNFHLECPFGEDEYMCDYYSSLPFMGFRSREDKRSFRRVKQHVIQLSPYPPDANTTQLDSKSISIFQSLNKLSSNTPSPPSSSSFSPYWCNRGLGVLSAKNAAIVCFCPPQYYGEKCEYHADRLSVVLQLNLSQSISTWNDNSLRVLKLLVLFSSNN